MGLPYLLCQQKKQNKMVVAVEDSKWQIWGRKFERFINV